VRPDGGRGADARLTVQEQRAPRRPCAFRPSAVLLFNCSRINYLEDAFNSTVGVYPRFCGLQPSPLLHATYTRTT